MRVKNDNSHVLTRVCCTQTEKTEILQEGIISVFLPEVNFKMTAMFILGILGGLGAPEIIIILVIVLLMFGGKKIPELMKGLGRGIKDFKDASKGESADSNTPEKK